MKLQGNVAIVTGAGWGLSGSRDCRVSRGGGSARERSSEFRASSKSVWEFVIERNLTGNNLLVSGGIGL